MQSWHITARNFPKLADLLREEELSDGTARGGGFVETYTLVIHIFVYVWECAECAETERGEENNL